MHKAYRMRLFLGFLFILISNASKSHETFTKTFHDLGPGIRNVYTQLYSYNPELNSNAHQVIFKYADLVNRAIIFKLKNPDVDVSIKMAIYKIVKNSFIGIKENTESYGKVSDKNFPNAEKFVWTLRRAKAAGIKVQFIYHNPRDSNIELDGGISNYLDNSMKINTEFKRVNWGLDVSKKFDTTKQMHNKFLTVSHALGEDGKVMKNIIYVATSNIDKFDGFKPDDSKDFSQSGILIYSHPPLYKAYNKYFDLIWENSTSYDGFVKSIHSAHNSKKGINYSDGKVFSAYFYPMPTESESNRKAWRSIYNPLVLMYYKAKKKSIKTNKYMRINAYTIKSTGKDEFVSMFNKKISKLRKEHLAQNKDLFVQSIIHRTRSDDSLDFEPFDGQRSGKRAKTHTKNYLFSFPYYNEFYTITGSANFKRDAFTKKANNLVMIEESKSHEVYSWYWKLFYSIFNNSEKHQPR